VGPDCGNRAPDRNAVQIHLKKAEAVSLKLFGGSRPSFIAKHIRSNVAELEGALKERHRLFALSTAETSRLTPPRRRLGLQRQKPAITVDNIQKNRRRDTKIKVSDMHSKKRSRNVRSPGQLAMAPRRTHPNEPYRTRRRVGNRAIRQSSMRVAHRNAAREKTTTSTAIPRARAVLKG